PCGSSEGSSGVRRLEIGCSCKSDFPSSQGIKDMKRTAFICALMCLVLSAQAQNYSPEELARRTIERRAVEAAIWGMPIVAMDAMRKGFLRDMEAKHNDIVFYSKPADWKFQTTTPNASTHYIYSAYDTRRDGPIVIEVPPAVGAGLYGQLCDMWD